MTGRLVDYIGTGLAAALPAAATVNAALTAGAAGFYYATDTSVFYVLDRVAVAWDTVGGTQSGTSFPGSPSTGQKFYRSDRNIEYVYDGTRWLSTQLICIPIVSQALLQPMTSTEEMRTANPAYNLYSFYLEDFILSTISAGSTGTHYFNFTLYSSGGASFTVLSNTLTTQSHTVGHSVGQRQSLNLVIPSTQALFNLTHAEVGSSANASITATLFGRLIG